MAAALSPRPARPRRPERPHPAGRPRGRGVAGPAGRRGPGRGRHRGPVPGPRLRPDRPARPRHPLRPRHGSHPRRPGGQAGPRERPGGRLPGRAVSPGDRGQPRRPGLLGDGAGGPHRRGPAAARPGAVGAGGGPVGHSRVRRLGLLAGERAARAGDRPRRLAAERGLCRQGPLRRGQVQGRAGGPRRRGPRPGPRQPLPVGLPAVGEFTQAVAEFYFGPGGEEGGYRVGVVPVTFGQAHTPSDSEGVAKVEPGHPGPRVTSSGR